MASNRATLICTDLDGMAGRLPLAIAGSIEITAQGVGHLALLGALPGEDSRTRFLSPTEPLDSDKWICGVLKDGGFVLLGRLRRDNSGFSVTMAHESYSAWDCLVFGIAPKEPVDHTTCSVLRIPLTGLEEWFSPRPLRIRSTKRGLIVRATPDEDQVYDGLPDREIRIVHRIAPPFPSQSEQSIHLRQLTDLEVHTKNPLSLDLLREQLHTVEDLLLLLTDADVGLTWPMLDFGTAQCTYYFHRRSRPTSELHWPSFWMSWKPAAFGTALEALHTQRDALGPGLYLYLGTRRASGFYLENRFATYIWGLEALHRRSSTRDSAQPTMLEVKVARILNAVDAKDHKWLAGKLKNAGEPSLEERLTDVFSELELGIEPSSLRAFAKECADLRNEISHFGGQRHGAYREFVARLVSAEAVVQHLYHAVLLQRLSVPKEQVQHYFLHAPLSNGRKRMLKAAGLALKAAPDETT